MMASSAEETLPKPPTSEYLSVSEAAQYLHVSESWLYRRVALGKAAEPPVPFIRFGRIVRFLKGELDAWAKKLAG